MTAIMQTVLFMLAVLAVAARKLNVAPSTLLVVAGIGMALCDAHLLTAQPKG